MSHIYFLNLFNDTMIEQTHNLEKLIDFKMHVGYANVSNAEMENQVRWAERERMDAIVCQWEDYEKIMAHKSLLPVYPVRIAAYDTRVILYFLKKHLKEKGLAPSSRASGLIWLLATCSTMLPGDSCDACCFRIDSEYSPSPYSMSVYVSSLEGEEESSSMTGGSNAV